MDEITMLNLEAAAKAATRNTFSVTVMTHGGNDTLQNASVKYIALANPENVLDLIAEVHRLRAEVERLSSKKEWWG